MHQKAFHKSLTVDVVLEQWPETAPVFQEFKTACVGCAMARFDTIDDVVRIYNLDLRRFMKALQTAIAGAGGEGEPA